MTYIVRDAYGHPHRAFSIKEAKQFYCSGRRCEDCQFTTSIDDLGNYPCFRLNNEEILNLLGDEIVAVPDEEISESSESNDAANDPVNHPAHYTTGGIECIDAILAALTCQTDPGNAWYTGQIIKYLWRWPMKNGLEDLKKAQFYLNRLIERVEGKESAE